jgi:hypothetical protein
MQDAALNCVEQDAAAFVQTCGAQVFAIIPVPVQKIFELHPTQLPVAVFKRYPELQAAAFVGVRQLEA